jgi:hypothetical protein
MVCDPYLHDAYMRRFTDSNHPDFWEPRRLIQKATVPEK